MTVEEFKYPLYFMLNWWNEEACSMIFNGYRNLDDENYKYSIGHHIWNKYVEDIESYGTYGAVIIFLMNDLDTEHLQKLIDYATKFYRKN